VALLPFGFVIFAFSKHCRANASWLACVLRIKGMSRPFSLDNVSIVFRVDRDRTYNFRARLCFLHKTGFWVTKRPSNPDIPQVKHMPSGLHCLKRPPELGQ